jgi:HlyD family secretion protein
MRNLLFLIAAISLTNCSNSKQQADAFGNFEADETLVSAEMSGKILWLDVEEGNVLEKEQAVGLIDTIMPSLQLLEIDAQKQRVWANMKSIESQIEVLNQQKTNLTIDFERISTLIESGAATQKQLDDISGALKVIEKQMAASESQKTALSKEVQVIDSKSLLLDEQLTKCKIRNPLKGTVLEKYAEPGEITAAGKPLYKIADVENIILRVYVSGGQMHQVIKGKACKVRIDKGKKEFIEYDGTISWISSKAEFTPKIIQTKEERVSMVYAVKINVKNDGSINIGMPGEVLFSRQSAVDSQQSTVSSRQ